MFLFAQLLESAVEGTLRIATKVIKALGGAGRLEAWKNAAAACGLQAVEVTHEGLTARKGPLEVRMDGCPRLGYGSRIVVVGPWPPGFHSVRLRRETRRLKSQVPEIEVGGGDFDSTFLLEGPLRLVSSLLDAKVRLLMVRVNAESRLEIARGELQVDVSNDRLHDVLPLLLDLAHRLAQPFNVARRLSDNALSHPDPEIRLRNLVLLVRECTWDERMVETLRKACSDASPEVRLRAARELGAEARHVLVDLVEYCQDDEVSAQAVSSLSRALSLEKLEAVLTGCLHTGRRKTALACLEALSRCGGAAVDVLAWTMAHEEGDLAVAAAEALGTTGSTAAEPALILALHREAADVRLAAAQALGSVGSAAAILPLKEAAERAPLNREISAAIRQAIADIQFRAPGASPGQLSLAGSEAGLLSLADAEAGRLSLVQAEPGQLSMATSQDGQLSLSPEEPDKFQRDGA
jgi:HEAT repeat protein